MVDMSSKRNLWIGIQVSITLLLQHPTSSFTTLPSPSLHHTATTHPTHPTHPLPHQPIPTSLSSSPLPQELPELQDDNSDPTTGYGLPTELPDSLDDAALIAAESTSRYASFSGPLTRCRVDFDTSVGDETFTALKRSTEFMQKYVTALSYRLVPELNKLRDEEDERLNQAREELARLVANPNANPSLSADEANEQRRELMQTIQNGGRILPPPPTKRKEDPIPFWTGPKLRIYFPDEGSAALARRDWLSSSPNPSDDIVPPCVEFSSCGGVQDEDTTHDVAQLFFCPRASEAEFVETILRNTEMELGDQLRLTVFVNPVLVDMGVTGFGMAGRMLRERLIDPLVTTYYLRTLSWGALTRVWPQTFTVWQEDADREGGYRMIKSLDRLPSNPEVEDIYDYENGNSNDPELNKGFGFLDAIADFANGMMKL